MCIRDRDKTLSSISRLLDTEDTTIVSEVVGSLSSNIYTKGLKVFLDCALRFTMGLK